MKILAVAGASGGHIFPAVAFIESTRRRHPDAQILLVLPRRSAVPQAQLGGCEVRRISISAIRRRLDWRNIVSAFNFLKGSLESVLILLDFRPDAVVGFGSIVSLPALVCAWLCRFKTVIHEQNVVPGAANRVLAWFSDAIAVSFSQTGAYLQPYRDKIKVTGNPVRAGLARVSKEEALNFFGFRSGKKTLLVMGGSQGSHRINLAVPEAVSGMSGRTSLQIIHLCGAQDLRILEEAYAKLGIPFRLFAFFETMQYAYCAGDMAISRAGATTVAELIHFNLPALLIPYPYAAAHQAANARLLQGQGCARVLEEQGLTAASLREAICACLDHPEALMRMRQAYVGVNRPDAGDALADIVANIYA